MATEFSERMRIVAMERSESSEHLVEISLAPTDYNSIDQIVKFDTTEEEARLLYVGLRMNLTVTTAEDQSEDADMRDGD